jgi:hypothetical protein
MSITLITRNDWRVATELINILERANQVRICNLLEIYTFMFIHMLCQVLRALLGK